MIDRIPEELIVLDATENARLILAKEALEATLDLGTRHSTAPDWPRLTDHTDCLVIVKEALKKCPDEAPSASVKELRFIPDTDFRNTLGVDIGSAERARGNAEWKAATVLGGSIVEALLLWAIQQHDMADISAAILRLAETGAVNRDLPPHDLLSRSWGLYQYTEVAYGLREINEQTANLCRTARYYRNLIHPAASERERTKCSRATANAAISAVYSTIEDLEAKHPT